TLGATVEQARLEHSTRRWNGISNGSFAHNARREKLLRERRCVLAPGGQRELGMPRGRRLNDCQKVVQRDALGAGIGPRDDLRDEGRLECAAAAVLARRPHEKQHSPAERGSRVRALRERQPYTVGLEG